MSSFLRWAAAVLAAALLLTGITTTESGVPTVETEAAGITSAASEMPAVETEVAGITDPGNLVLGISAEGLLALGYEYGDLLAVTVNGCEMEMPLCSNYSDVDSRQLVCRADPDISEEEDLVFLAINMGDLATTLGIAKKAEIEESPGFRWDYQVETPVPVTLSMKEEGGYEAEFLLHRLTRSNSRGDYSSLTDSEYANFRNVATTGMGTGALYRSSSPLDPALNRNAEADRALHSAGIRTVVNLADIEEDLDDYPDYSSTHYSRLDIIAVKLPADYTDDSFPAGLAEGFRFMASHEGPYLIHCKEGKDRTGFACAVLECLMGASAEEAVADYMITYLNFYGVAPDTKQYDAIRRGIIEKTLSAIFGVDDLYKADLSACAKQTLRGIGLTEDEITALKQRLARAYPASAD